MTHPTLASNSTSSSPLPSSARVVIVGGGVMGCGLAYHLCKAGWTDIVLLEKAELTSGSTWHAAGQVGHSTSDFALGRFAQYASELYPKMESETGLSPTWNNCGSLRIAYARDEVDWLKHTASVGRALGLRMEIVGPDAVRKLHPFYKTDGVRAALYTPDDGHADPAGAARSMAKGAKDLGAAIVRRCRAVGFSQKPSGEWRVQTERGEIACEHVVNAAGAYARQVGEWVGLQVPYANLLHTYFVTEPVPEFADLPRDVPVIRDDREVSGYIRMEQKSGLVGIYEKQNQTTAWDDGVAWELENELFDADYDAVSPWLENAMERMPVLRPARNPPRRARRHHASAGRQHAARPRAGTPKFLVELRQPSRNRMGSRRGEISRAVDDDRRGRMFPCARSTPALRRLGGRESVSHCKGQGGLFVAHEIPYPRFDRPAARPVQVSPLHDEMLKRGAVMEQAFGWERPAWFATGDVPQAHIHSFRRAALHKIVGDECRALRNYAAVADMTALESWKCAVPGRLRFWNECARTTFPASRAGSRWDISSRATDGLSLRRPLRVWGTSAFIWLARPTGSWRRGIG